MGTLIAILGIVVMIVLHEWGHFIAARIFKLPVYEFAIGIGPLLWKHKGKKGTLFTLRALPIGGYCAFDDTEDSSIQDAALDLLPPWKRIIISFAGPLMNFVVGFVIFLSITLFIGIPTTTNKVLGTIDGYPAVSVFEQGDVILSVDGMDVTNMSDLSAFFANNYTPGSEVEIVYDRNGEIKTAHLTPQAVGEQYAFGISMESIYRKPVGSEWLTETVALTIDAGKQVFLSLKYLVTGKAKLSEMSGIIGIVQFAGEYATFGTLYTFFTILAIVSVNLGIVNLLPIPALDGSKILFSIIEFLRGGKKLPKKLEETLITVSFFLLIGLMIVVAFNDIIKILF